MRPSAAIWGMYTPVGTIRSKPLVPPDACSLAIASSFELKTVTVTLPNLSSSSCEWYSAQVKRLSVWFAATARPTAARAARAAAAVVAPARSQQTGADHEAGEARRHPC